MSLQPNYRQLHNNQLFVEPLAEENVCFDL